MNEGLDPKEFGISIEEIDKKADILLENKEDKRPPEHFTRDTLDKYQEFAKEHLGFEFHDITLFITALTHRSYVNEYKKIHIEHNERLEFLG